MEIGRRDQTTRRNQDDEVAFRAILLGARFSCLRDGARNCVINGAMVPR